MGLEHVNRANIEALNQEVKILKGEVSSIDPIVTDESFPNIKPPVPRNVLATGLFRNIMVSWDYDMASYIGAYEVYASQDANFTPLANHLIWRGKASSYIHEASTDQTWYFRVRAVNTHGVPSDFSDQVTGTTARIAGLEIEETWRIDLLEEANLYTNERRAEIMQEVAKKIDADFVHGQLLLKVDLTDFNGTITRLDNDMGGFMERLNVAETNISSNNDAILLRATRQEMDVRIGDVVHRLDHQEGVLTVQANEIAQKVEKTEYDALTQRVTTAEGQISTQAGQILLRATTTDLNATNQRLSTAESTIVAQGNAINLRVEKNNIISEINMSPEQIKINTAKLTIDGDVEVINGLVKLKDAIIDRANIRAGAIDTVHIRDGAISNLKVGELNADKITAGVFHINRIPHLTADKITVGSSTTFASGYDPTKIEVGGRNLVRDSNNFLSGVTNFQGSTRTTQPNQTISEWNTTEATRMVSSGGTHTVKFIRTVIVGTNTTNGDVYVLSLWVKNNGNKAMRITGNAPSNVFEIPVGFSGRVVIYATANGSTNIQFNFSTLVASDNIDITVWRMQVEKGNKATDWTPAPEDIEANISNAVKPANDRIALWQWGNTTEIDGGNIRTNTVTATQINVNNLSAISANLGNVTAGTISGVNINGSTFTTTGSNGKANIQGDTIEQYIGHDNVMAAIGNWRKTALLRSGEIEVIHETNNGGARTTLELARLRDGSLTLLRSGVGFEVNGSLLQWTGIGQLKSGFQFNASTHSISFFSENPDARFEFAHASGITMTQFGNFQGKVGAATNANWSFLESNGNRVMTVNYGSGTGKDVVVHNNLTIANSSNGTGGISHNTARVTTVDMGYSDATHVHLYLRPKSNGETRSTVTGSTTVYRPHRALQFIAETADAVVGSGTTRLVANDGGHATIQTNGGSGTTSGLVFLQPSGDEARVTAPGTLTTYKTMRAAAFPTSSTVTAKTNIKEYHDVNLINMLKTVKVYEYRLKQDLQDGIYDKQKVGMLSEAVPSLLRDGEGVDPYIIVSVLWRVCQEQQSQLERLIKRVEDLEFIQ